MVKRIMVVDDEPDVLFSLKILLERNNYDVVIAHNGNECLREMEKGFKGIVLMDLMMPNMDGWETINEIIKRGLMSNIEIEIITGNGTKAFQRMTEMGSYIFDYMVKPLDIRKLLLSIERCNKHFNIKNT
jgi:DNA-binding response OmpR family regulator